MSQLSVDLIKADESFVQSCNSYIKGWKGVYGFWHITIFTSIIFLVITLITGIIDLIKNPDFWNISGVLGTAFGLLLTMFFHQLVWGWLAKKEYNQVLCVSDTLWKIPGFNIIANRIFTQKHYKKNIFI